MTNPLFESCLSKEPYIRVRDMDRVRVRVRVRVRGSGRGRGWVRVGTNFE